jgi:hypothetical protein
LEEPASKEDDEPAEELAPLDGVGQIGVEHMTLPEAVELDTIEVGNLAFAHDVDVDMVDLLGTKLYAVRVSETAYVGRTLVKVKLDRIPAALQKKMRPRTKNLVFTDSPATFGLFVPYTRAAYFALPRRERKQVLLTAVSVMEYNRAISRLALLHHVSDERMFEKLAYYEAHCCLLAEGLPTAPEWTPWIKEL